MHKVQTTLILCPKLLLNYFQQIYKTAIEEMQDLGELGNGTCGHVVKMMHKLTGEVIAVKVCNQKVRDHCFRR